MFSAQSRIHNIQRMKNETFDVAIIGGGINGAGIARDAASRGLKVALIEASDFASGTSSRSSKLIHGGLRYLESLEFGLVFEALSERRKLFEMAPNMVHPLRFVLPIYKGDRVGMFKMGLGMMLYDVLALFEAPKTHRRLNPEETLRELPHLNPEGLLGSYAYYDAYMDDDRLVHESMRSATDSGAISANYVKAIGADTVGGKVTALKCNDQITGSSFSIQARHFVSTVGPWTDILGTDLLQNWSPIMRPSKGVHLTFRKERFPLKDAVVMAADAQKRIVFGIPRHEMVIVGTTDTDFSGDPSDVHSTEKDIRYLLQVANQYFPGAKLTEKDIVASYSGVRPLVADGSTSESATSREHTIINDPRNVTFVAGGKYTTYRHMAEESVESFLSMFSVEEQVKWAKSKSELPLNPLVTNEALRSSHERIDSKAGSWPLSDSSMHWFVERHGAEAFKILGSMTKRDREFEEETLIWRLEARHAIRNTMCLSLKDFYLRRVPLFLTEFDHGYSFLEAVAEVFVEQLGLQKGEVNQQFDALKQYEQSEMGWRPAPISPA
ncbi:MAG: glycerol-3-phosphate dehydrogenase/oxidase [Pseudomonadota bacterium]